MKQAIDIHTIRGSIWGVVIGDALGAGYEGGVVERAVWKLIGQRKGKLCWTDDTQMSVDIIHSLMACGGIDQNDLAARFASSYRWTRGYGPGTAKILKKIRKGVPWLEANRLVYKNGSFGNGAAMRVAPIGLFFAEQGNDVIVDAAVRTAQITHVHPLGIDGATILALAVANAALNLETLEIMAELRASVSTQHFQDKLQVATDWLRTDTVSNERRSVQDVRYKLGNGVPATESVVTAIYCALAHRNSSFEELLSFIRRLGGDVDTIGAMAGAVFGAACGEGTIPNSLKASIDSANVIDTIANQFSNEIFKRKAGE